MPRILNLGSINIDHVYKVPHFVRPGETLASSAYQCGLGGKGFNQSVALARAGAQVVHAGAVGADGASVLDRMRREGIDTACVRQVDGPTGHAIIQVNPEGQNAIVLYAGANASIDPQALPGLFSGMQAGDHFLCQNETTAVPDALRLAKERGLTVWFNPAPMDAAVLDYPLEAVDWLVVNETEGSELTGEAGPDAIIRSLSARYPRMKVVLTLGADGACVHAGGSTSRFPALVVTPVDTTAAGDTFIGYLAAGIMRGQSVADAVEMATRAAAIAVTRPGAADSIPMLRELD